MLPNPTQDHLSLRWTFVGRHIGAELSGSMGDFSGCQELENVYDLIMTPIRVREEGWDCKTCPGKEESRCYTFTTSLFWNQKASIQSLPSLGTFSGSVNQMFQKLALPPSQPIGLTSFHVKGIDSETPDGSLLKHWFLLNILPPNAFDRSQNSVLLRSFPFSSL